VSKRRQGSKAHTVSRGSRGTHLLYPTLARPQTLRTGFFPLLPEIWWRFPSPTLPWLYASAPCMIPSRISGPLVLGFLGCAACLVGTVAYSRAVLGDPLRLTHDADGVVRFLTREEALQAHLAASEKLQQANPSDAARARVTAVWRDALRQAQATGSEAAPPRPASSDELNL
jgi:hypothetical protein